jgi:hypothetical protein
MRVFRMEQNLEWTGALPFVDPGAPIAFAKLITRTFWK